MVEGLYVGHLVAVPLDKSAAANRKKTGDETPTKKQKQYLSLSLLNSAKMNLDNECSAV